MNWPGYYDKAMFDSYLHEDCTWTELEDRFGSVSLHWLWRVDEVFYGQREV